MNLKYQVTVMTTADFIQQMPRNARLLTGNIFILMDFIYPTIENLIEEQGGKHQHYRYGICSVHRPRWLNYA